jgi:hypothetical protein
LACGSYEIKIWDTVKGIELKTFTGDSSVKSLPVMDLADLPDEYLYFI